VDEEMTRARPPRPNLAEKDVSFGSKEWQKQYGLERGATRPANERTRRVRAQGRQAQKEARQAERQAKTSQRQREKIYQSILGPGGRTYGVKVAPQQGVIDTSTVDQLVQAGWLVFPAGTVPGKLGRPLSGATLNPSDDDYLRILGPERQARAVVVALPTRDVDRATVDQWRSQGYDVGPAPKAIREGKMQMNPGSPGTETQAIAKAREWFGRDDLVTEPESLPWTPPQAAVEIGQLVAIEYASDKWTGKEVIYRHEFEEERRMAISLDGTTIVVFPPFRITKRGIEG